MAADADDNVLHRRPLRVLIVEDNPNDTELMVEELRAGGFDPDWTCIQSHTEFFDRLNDGFDVVLADYRVPGWDMVKALRELKARNLDVPVIVVSGSIGEEQAVETLQEGAVDYILKDRIRRLGPAVTRALERTSAARALLESEQRYRAMFETNPVPMWVYDSETLKFLAVNEAAVEHYGYTRQEFLRLTASDIRHADDQRALADDTGHISGEFRHRHKDGTLMDVRINSQSSTFMQHTACVILATDISDQKRAERELRESEERFRRITETIAEVFWVVDPGINTMAYVSRAYEKIWGRSRESLYNNPRSFLDAVHPDDHARVIETLNLQVEGVPFDHEYRIIRPDGEVRWIWDRGYPVRDPQGHVVQYVRVAQDITLRRRAEEALREGEERTRLTLSASGVGVWESDLWSGEAYWSEVCEALHGLKPGTFGKTNEAFLALVHPDDREQIMKATDRAVRERSHAEFEYRTRGADGAERLISCTAHFFYNDEGVPVRSAGILSDVTDRRSLETQLRQAQKMEAVGQLAGGVAHDFNNLLTAILGFAELLTSQFKKGDAALKDLEQIHKAATRATHLTRQLLAFSRRQILQPVTLDLNRAVTDLAAMLRRLISEDIDINLRLDAAIGCVKADQGQIEQVIMNLAVNARDAMPEGGSLTIATANVDVDDEFFKRNGVAPQHDGRQFVVLSVADTGTGMDPAIKARIFEPFFTTKVKGKGTGLGLATVYGIVKQSGGFVWVYSEPGAGATFKVFLPRTQGDAPRDVAPALQAKSVRGHEVVLLVEDEEGVRMLARALFERNGYTVIEAPDAEQAIQLAQEHKAGIDLLVSDVVMPGKNGPELFAALSASLPALKVLYMSGYTDEANVKRGVLQPGTQFVQKPFTAAALMQKVRETLDAAPQTT